MTLHRGVVSLRVTVFGLAIAAHQLPAQALPLDEQVFLYVAAIRANAARIQLDRTRLPLLLVTVADSVEFPPGVRSVHHRGSALDSALVQALVDSAVVAGVCHPLGPQRCEGGQRGLGVRLQPIHLIGDATAWVGLYIRVMQAEHDNAYLVDSDRGQQWRFRRIDGRWQLDPPHANAGEAVPHN